MDAQKQKPQMTRWLAGMFVALSLAVSCETQAAVDSVSPTNFFWVSNVDLVTHYSSFEAAYQAVGSGYWGSQSGVVSWTPNGTNNPNHNWDNYSCTPNMHTYIRATGMYILVLSNGSQSYAGSIFCAEVDCPIPATHPTITYSYNTANGMCERNVPCRSPDVLNASGQCVPPENLVITLQGGTTIEPGQSTRFTVTVENQLDHQPPKNPVTVNISLKVEATSGGHAHGDSTRPRGSIDNTQCASDATCKIFTIPAGSTTATFDFNSEPASGTHTVTANCDKCTNGAQEVKVDVKVGGLLPIPASQSYSLTEPINGGGTKIVGATKQHAENHFLTPAAANVLWRMAAAYYFEPRFMVFDKTLNKRVSPPLLYLNDASLEWGGKFDITGNWGGEHAEHKRGTVIDIRANPSGYGTMPLVNFNKFRQLASETTIDSNGAVVDAGIHCTRDKKSTPKSQRHNRTEPNCISQLDGSPDNNRHYHIRLMGVSE